jgi:hypothetical protein
MNRYHKIAIAYFACAVAGALYTNATGDKIGLALGAALLVSAAILGASRVRP